MYITVILNIIYSRSRQNNIQCKNAIHSIFDTHNYLWPFCSLMPRYMQNYGMKGCEPSCTSTVTINLLNVHVFFWLTLGKLQYHTRQYTAWPPRVLHDKFQNLFLGGEVVGRCVEALKSKVKVLHEKFQIWKLLPPPNWGNIRILGKKLILQSEMVSHKMRVRRPKNLHHHFLTSDLNSTRTGYFQPTTKNFSFPNFVQKLWNQENSWITEG